MMNIQTVRYRVTNWQKILFLAGAIGITIYLCITQKDMISISGDAADIWKTITSFDDEIVYPSYVLYKGVFSVYPYYWFYKLACFFKLNEFFFIFVFHAVMFSFITVIGMPTIIQFIFKNKVGIIQVLFLFFFLLWRWDKYYVISELMVDLPSCFCLIFCFCLAIWAKDSKHYRLFLALAALFCGICVNYSGQYIVSAIFAILFLVVVIFSTSDQWKNRILDILIVCAFLGVVFLVNNEFKEAVITKIEVQNNTTIAKGTDWLSRGLIYFIDKSRHFYGPGTLFDERGKAILSDIYGKKEAARIMELAAAGSSEGRWTIAEYLQHVIDNPINFAALYVDRLIVMIADDLGRQSFVSLVLNISFLYLFIVICVKRFYTFKSFFSRYVLIIVSILCSVIPLFVGVVEMRYVISVQALVYSTVLVGPIFQTISMNLVKVKSEVKRYGFVSAFSSKPFPWLFIGWLVFCLVIMSYFGEICEGSITEVLFR